MKLFPPALCAVASVFLATSQMQAQVMTNTRIDFGLTYPGASASGYVSPTEHYSYNTGSFIYINGDRNRMIYMDYLDRADRAAKFGYRMPVDPFFPPTPPLVNGPVPEEHVFPPTPRVANGSIPEEHLIAEPVSNGGFFGFLRRRWQSSN